jgi:translation initiation factor IF-2
MTKSKKKKEILQTRQPVVVFLGHVDAGKSSIVDYIRKSDIVAREAGGITQHIGAYEVKDEKGREIVFIDTPGHAAFSSIRARGAKIADIAVLVIGVDQGIKPQTKEAISYLKKTGVSCIVAINKIDIPGLDPATIEGQLAKEGIVVENQGGEIPVVELSAKTGKGMDHLLDIIFLIAEMEDWKQDVTKSATGIVIESRLDSQQGPVATLLIQEGVLRKGDLIGTSSTKGRIKNLVDSNNHFLEQASPPQPISVLGLEKVPIVGDKFRFYDDPKEIQALLDSVPVNEKKPKDDSQEENFNLILKADVASSLEAIKNILGTISVSGVKLNVVKEDVGKISQVDIKQAYDTHAQVVGFRVDLNAAGAKFRERENILVKTFAVIYNLADYVEQEMKKKKEPEEVRREIGKLKVLAIFKKGEKRQIVGGDVIEGQVEKGAQLDIFRGKEKIGSGRLVELEREKKKLSLVKKGQQAGIAYEGSGEIEKDDLLEVYRYEKN